MIIVQNGTWAKIEGTKISKELQELLYYKVQKWSARGPKTHQRSMLYPDNIFPVGILPKIKNERILRKKEKTRPKNPPKLKDIIFRDYQTEACMAGLKKNRGVIVAPTGSGKTIICGGIISAYPQYKFLVLVHTKDLLLQTSAKLKKFGLQNFILGDGNKKWGVWRVCVATAQTLAGMKQPYQFDGIIVDECHRIGITDGNRIKKVPDLNQHGQIIARNTKAMIKIGLTGSMPTDDERLRWIEGLLGPVIHTVPEQVQVERGHLAKVKITFLDAEKPKKDEAKDWRAAYDEGITKSNIRAFLIKEAIRERRGKSIIIFVKLKEHGEMLAKKIGLPFIHGGTPASERRKLQILLENKKIQGVITTVWKEGVDIKSLDVVILAGGGKSTISILQWIGRGLRTTKTKKEIEVIDFIDKEKNLAVHFAERVSLYCNKGWL